MQHTVLAVQSVSKYFTQAATEIMVLRTISIQFEQGNTYAITGVSGSGKSTFIHILAGLDVPTNGVITFNNQDIANFSFAQRSQLLNVSIGLVFQNPYLIRELSVIENVMIPGLIRGEYYHACMPKAQELLIAIGLADKAHEKPSSLSGGQQQRVALARALFNKPIFLIADEPTGNLDEHTGSTMIDLMIQLQQEWHMGIIVSTHDAYVAQRMKYIYELRDGALHRMYNGNI